jgi:tetratricopeptide (TPR) repeat protein
MFAIVSWEQTKTWHDSISVFRHALAVTSDNYIAEANLGSALFDAGRKAEGLAHYNEAIRLHAPALEHHRQTALEAERRHQLPTAIHHYGKVLTLIPWDADVHQRLGSVLLQNGEYAKALVQYNEALRYDRSAIPPSTGCRQGSDCAAKVRRGARFTDCGFATRCGKPRGRRSLPDATIRVSIQLMTRGIFLAEHRRASRRRKVVHTAMDERANAQAV